MPAHRGEDERRRVAEHRREERRPDDDVLELADARAGREVADRDPERRRPRSRPTPSRRSPRAIARCPSATASRPTTIGQTGLRAVTGGSATQAASDAERRSRPIATARRARHGGRSRRCHAAALRRAAVRRRLAAGLALPRSGGRATRRGRSRPRRRRGRRGPGSASSGSSPARAGRSRGRGCGSTCRCRGRRRAAPRAPTPTAVLRPSSATAIPMKPIVRDVDVVRVESELPAEHVHRAREAREAAGDRHREEVVARDADAAVARRLGIEADRPHLVAERRPVERDPVDDERGDRDEEAEVQPLEDRIAPERPAASLPRRRRPRRDRRLVRVLQRPAEPEEVERRPRSRSS